MKTFDELREGFVSAAQRKAVWASRADGGKGHPDNKKKKSKKEDVQELDTSTLISYRKKANKQRFSSDKKTGQRTTGIDMANKKLRKRNIDKFGKHSPKGVDKMGNPKEDTSDAVKAFLAKGGKIKKLPPAKAQGYHGKDDPGKGMHGMMDKPDTKAMGTRKKVKSMESLWDNIRKRRAAGKPKLKPGDKNYPKTLKINDDVKEAMKYTHVAVDKKGKVAGMASKASDAKDMARRHGGTHHQLKKPMHPKVGDMMINRPFNPVLKKEMAKRVVHSDKPDSLKSIKVMQPKGKKDEGYKSYAQQKAVWASRADAKKKGKK